jgi:hypothetical protein
MLPFLVPQAGPTNLISDAFLHDILVDCVRKDILVLLSAVSCGAVSSHDSYPESEFRVPVRHISPAVVVKHKDPPAKKDADIASDLTKWVLRGSGVPPDEAQIVGTADILIKPIRGLRKSKVSVGTLVFALVKTFRKTYCHPAWPQSNTG